MPVSSPPEADPFRGSILSCYLGEGFRFRCELRPRHFTGPQRACHPNELEISLVERGTSTFLLDQHFRGRLCAGEFGVVPPQIEHSSWTRETPVLETNLHYSVERVEEAAASLGVDSKDAVSPDTWLRCESLPATESMKGVLQALRCEAASGQSNRLTMQSLATALLSMILRQASSKADPRRNEGLARSGVLRAAERLRAEPSRDHSLEELAASAGLSRFHFLRAFRKEHGLPPHSYLLSLRLERAAELMRNTDLPLTTIAYDVGFGSSSRLTEAFQRRFGLVPSLWRKGQAPASCTVPRQLTRSQFSETS